MIKVEDLFYFIMRGLADKSLTMDTPIMISFNGYAYNNVEGVSIRNEALLLEPEYYEFD